MKNTVKSFNPIVIEGGGRKATGWLELPDVALGPSPFKRNENTVFKISQATIRKSLEVGRRQPLLDLWSGVFGKIPPVNNAFVKFSSEENLSRLRPLTDAHACFRGIKRPIGNDDTGFDVYAFVIKSGLRFQYKPDMSCLISAVKVPSDLLLIVYVRMDYPHGRKKAIVHPSTSQGVITHWEFVEADDSGLLPIDHKTRYRRRIW